MRALAALAIVVAGAVAALALVTFGQDAVTTQEQPAGPREFVLRQGDRVVMPAAATECEATHEANIPRLFCTRTGASRYQVIINRDVVQVYDLEDPNTEPFEPTYSVPATSRR
jgi:hypothetical protein